MQVCKKMADSVLHVSIAGKIDTVTAPALDRELLEDCGAAQRRWRLRGQARQGLEHMDHPRPHLQGAGSAGPTDFGVQVPRVGTEHLESTHLGVHRRQPIGPREVELVPTEIDPSP